MASIQIQNGENHLFFFWPGNTNASILKHEKQVASTLLCL